MRIRTFNQHTLEPGHTGRCGGIHSACELLYFTKGQAVLEWMGCEYAAPSPSLFLLTPNTPHHLVRYRPPVQFWYIELSDVPVEAFPTVEQAICWNRFQERADYDGPDLQAVRQMLDMLDASLPKKLRGVRRRSPAFYDEEIVLLDIRKTLRLIHNYMRTTKQPASKHDCKSTRELILDLKRHMESNYCEPLDLAALSGKAHLHPAYLVRAFKQEIGVTPLQYLNGLRLSAATSYLANSEMGIQRIAEATGFNSIHYFSRLFKQKFGRSPQQWRIAQKG